MLTLNQFDATLALIMLLIYWEIDDSLNMGLKIPRNDIESPAFHSMKGVVLVRFC